MSVELNCIRCCDEYLRPQLLKMEKKNPQLRKLLDLTAKHVKQLGQDPEDSKQIVGYPKSLWGAFKKAAADGVNLYRYAHLVYYAGHLAYPNTSMAWLQSSGLYWKFQLLADAVVEIPFEARKACKEGIDECIQAYNDHVDGSTYSLDELRKLLQADPVLRGSKLLHVCAIKDYNTWRLHPFTITSRHLAASTGAYLDASVAPCGTCDRAADEHVEVTCVAPAAALEGNELMVVMDALQAFAARYGIVVITCDTAIETILEQHGKHFGSTQG